MPAEFQANVGSGLVRNIPSLEEGNIVSRPIHSEIQTARAQWRTPNDQ